MLDYDLSDSTFRSLLKSVRQCDPNARCKWAKQLGWTTEQDAGDLTQVGVESALTDAEVYHNLGGPTWPFRLPPGAKHGGLLVGDFDDDGATTSSIGTTTRPRRTSTGRAEEVWGTLTCHMKLRLSKRPGRSRTRSTSALPRRPCTDNPGRGLPTPAFNGTEPGASRVLDIDGDGSDELYLARDPFVSTETDHRFPRVERRGGEFQALEPWVPGGESTSGI